MNENNWFFEENLLYPLTASTREEAISQLGGLLLKNGYVKESYIPAVKAREKEFATGLPTPVVGVAIPHTDSHHVLKQGIGIGILTNPVTFCEMGDSEDTPVDVRIVFMLAVPDKNKVMGMLQRLIAIIQSQDFLNGLTTTADRSKLVEILDKQLNVEFHPEAAVEKAAEVKKDIPEIALTIQHPVGLHARPATVFVKTAKQFTSEITVFYNNKQANAKSILKVLSLGAHNGSQIRIRAEGDDAQNALAELQALVESNFGGID